MNTSKLNPANLDSKSRRCWISSRTELLSSGEEGKSREETRYPLESSYVPCGSVIFVLLFFPIISNKHWIYAFEEWSSDVQKSYTSGRFVQTQPRPSRSEIQSAKNIRPHMSDAFHMVLERVSESGVFGRSIEDLVPVRSKDSTEGTA